MSIYNYNPAVFDHPLRLMMEEREFPHAVLAAFFTDYKLSEVRHNLWEMVQACLTTDNIAFQGPEERGDLLMHYERLEILLEACYLLWKRQQNNDEQIRFRNGTAL